MHDLIPLVAIIVTFGSITAIILVPVWLRSRERARMQDTVREAIEKGQGLPTDVIEAFTRGVSAGAKATPSRMRDLRRGVIWLAIAGAAITWGLIEQWRGGWSDPSDWYGIAAIPGFIGVAFLLLGLLNSKRD